MESIITTNPTAMPIMAMVTAGRDTRSVSSWLLLPYMRRAMNSGRDKGL